MYLTKLVLTRQKGWYLFIQVGQHRLRLIEKRNTALPPGTEEESNYYTLNAYTHNTLPRGHFTLTLLSQRGNEIRQDKHQKEKKEIDTFVL